MKPTKNEQLALKGLDGTGVGQENFYRGFRSIAEIGGLDLSLVRRTVRQCARKGWAVYAKGLWTDDGESAGAGYALTDAGILELKRIEQ